MQDTDINHTSIRMTNDLMFICIPKFPSSPHRSPTGIYWPIQGQEVVWPYIPRGTIHAKQLNVRLRRKTSSRIASRSGERELWVYRRCGHPQLVRPILMVNSSSDAHSIAYAQELTSKPCAVSAAAQSCQTCPHTPRVSCCLATASRHGRVCGNPT